MTKSERLILAIEKRCAAPHEEDWREAAGALLRDRAVVLPAPLAQALNDHLERRDSQGYSLCFDGIERQRLLAELTPHLLAHMEAIL
jgi:hypothetical protein